LTSDKAHFHLSGCVNTNFWYWATTNPKELHKRPLHSERVTVWGSAAEQQKTKRKKKKIKQILKNSEYHIHTTNTKPTTKLDTNEPHNPPKKNWITIIYFRPHTRMITNYSEKQD
jgi:TFIIF-interacting CTD phosphatase-like protein